MPTNDGARSVGIGRKATVALAALAVGAGASTLGAPSAHAVSTPVIAPGTINSIAGSAGAGNSLTLNQRPTGLLVTGSGVLVGDERAVVRLLDPIAHTQTVYAGVGAAGGTGDGGQATVAMIGAVRHVNRDPSGNVYIAASNQVRKVASDGTITTAVQSYGLVSGVAVNAAGDIYYTTSDTFTGSLRVKWAIGGDEQLASLPPAVMGGDVAMAADGTVYWADWNGERVYKRTEDGIITLVAGTGDSGYNGDGIAATSANLKSPTGVAVSGTDLYIADTGNNRLRKVSGGIITTVAGTGAAGDGGDGGPALSATVTPGHVALAPDGTIYVSTPTRVRAIAPSQIITTVAGTGIPSGFGGDGGPALNAQLSSPNDVVGLPDGSALIADTDNNRIRRVAANGTITTIAGNGTAAFAGDGGDPVLASLNAPKGVTRAPNGDIYISDTGNQRIRKISGGVITTVVGNGVFGFNSDGPALTRNLRNPIGLSVDLDGKLVFVDSGNGRVRRLDGANVVVIAGNGATSGAITDGVAPTASRLVGPTDVVVTQSGDLLIADMEGHRVRLVAGGLISTFAGTGVCDDTPGDGGPATAADVCYPVSVAVSGSTVFIASLSPAALFGAPALGNSRVRAVRAGTITTLAGNGVAAFSGDGGPASAARLLDPKGLSIDVDGGVLLADGRSHRIRKISDTGTISGAVTSGGTPLVGASVGLYGATGSGRLATVTTGAGGAYAFPGIAPGSYRLRAWSPSGVAVAEWYVDSATAAGAVLLPVTTGGTTTANFDLAGIGGIDGTVTSAGSPLNGATVVAYKASGGTVATTTTAGAGQFSFPTLADGTYKIKASAAGHVTEWFQDVATGTAATVLTVTAGNTVHLDGANAITLSSTASPELSGTVTIQSSGLPLSGAAVRLYTSAGFVRATTTAPDGSYSFIGSFVPGTTYYVRFGATGYTNEWWNESGPSFADADPLAFAGTPFTNINGTLS